MGQDYIVKQGDCMSSVAYEHGFYWKTLWNAGENESLKSKRKDPNALLAGDVIHIRDLVQKKEPGATAKRHKFRLKGVPTRLRLRLLRPPYDSPPPAEKRLVSMGAYHIGASRPAKVSRDPEALAPYYLEIDGKVLTGRTNGDGRINVPILPNAKTARLIVHRGTPQERIYQLRLGGPDPSDTITGVRKRLCNLGYLCSPTGRADAQMRAALAAFQKDEGMHPTGEPNGPTQQRLRSRHGC
jgi:hypothetical protein